jgi:signal peptide peptidase SppA
MKYARILAEVASTPYAIHPLKAEIALQFLAFAAAGHKRTPDEVREIVGFDQEDERRDRERQSSAPASAIQVLGVKGVISPRMSSEMNTSGGGGTSCEGLGQRFDAAMDDSKVSAVVLDFDSPGGSVFGVQEVASKIMRARGQKPIVAVVNPFCASAALWIACAADEIVVSPSGEIGSLGVYAYHESLAKYLEAQGVTPTLVKAGDNKAETHPAFELSAGAKAHMQARVDAYYSAFVRAVSEGRGVEAKRVIETFGGGRMFGAEEAVAIGMADRVGTLEGELARLKTQPAPASSAKAGGKRRLLALQ